MKWMTGFAAALFAMVLLTLYFAGAGGCGGGAEHSDGGAEAEAAEPAAAPRSTPQPEPRGDRAEDALWKWYQEYPIGGGWEVTSVKPSLRRDQLFVRLSLPPQQARALMRWPSERQWRIIGSGVCPSEREPLWAKIGRARLVIQATANDAVFVEVPCDRP